MHKHIPIIHTRIVKLLNTKLSHIHTSTRIYVCIYTQEVGKEWVDKGLGEHAQRQQAGWLKRQVEEGTEDNGDDSSFHGSAHRHSDDGMLCMYLRACDLSVCLPVWLSLRCIRTCMHAYTDDDEGSRQSSSDSRAKSAGSSGGNGLDLPGLHGAKSLAGAAKALASLTRKAQVWCFIICGHVVVCRGAMRVALCREKLLMREFGVCLYAYTCMYVYLCVCVCVLFCS
jgi:hypothetical protein